MPLSILVGVLNIEKTFLFQLYFITSDTTASFEFIEDQLDHFFFTTAFGQKLSVVTLLKNQHQLLPETKQNINKLEMERHIFFSYVNWNWLKRSNVT